LYAEELQCSAHGMQTGVYDIRVLKNRAEHKGAEIRQKLLKKIQHQCSSTDTNV